MINLLVNLVDRMQSLSTSAQIILNLLTSIIYSEIFLNLVDKTQISGIGRPKNFIGLEPKKIAPKKGANFFVSTVCKNSLSIYYPQFFLVLFVFLNRLNLKTT